MGYCHHNCRTFAVKNFFMPKIEREKFLAKVLKEFELGKSLSHPNIGGSE